MNNQREVLRGDFEKTYILSRLKKNYCDFSVIDVSPSYLFTTENIKGLLSQIDVKNKDILMPCSSGDHYFNFLLNEAKNITLFDKNSLAIHVLKLKKAAIQVLNRDDFFKFFYCKGVNLNFFDKDTYYKIVDKLEDSERLYWDRVFNSFPYFKLRYSALYRNSEYSKKELININEYLDEKKYKELGYILKYIDNVDFIKVDINNESINTSKTYDFIYFSNILDHVRNVGDKSEDILNICANYDSYLNDNGEIGVYYLFGYLDQFFDCCYEKMLKEDDKKINDFNVMLSLKKRKKFIEDNNNFRLLDFSNVMCQNKKNLASSDKDGLLVYKKKIR